MEKANEREKENAMVGKREQQNKRLRLPVVLLVLLIAGGLLLTVSGMIPGKTESTEPLPEDNTAEQLTQEVPEEPEKPDVVPELIPKEEVIVPVALPEEEIEPEEPVVPEEIVLDPEKPMIALTFDDGPGDYTDRLLDILAQHRAKATFFVVGRNISGHQETLKRAAEEGHEIGSHSWGHPQLTKLTQDGIREQLTKTRDKIQEAAGVEANLLRPPYGAQNKTVRAIAGEMGVVLINWNVDPKDWQLRNADKVYDAVISRVTDGDIILCHDIHATTIDAMERLIPDLQAQGYQLVTVTELLTSQGGEMVPGTQYRQRPASE